MKRFKMIVCTSVCKFLGVPIEVKERYYLPSEQFEPQDDS